FFFQAEDGIRDFHVTGVQTCALPISPCAPISLGCASPILRPSIRRLGPASKWSRALTRPHSTASPCLMATWQSDLGGTPLIRSSRTLADTSIFPAFSIPIIRYATPPTRRLTFRGSRQSLSRSTESWSESARLPTWE